MAYSTNAQDYDLRQLTAVAEMCFIENMSHREIGEQLHIHPRAKVVAMCQAARNAGMVRVSVTPPPNVMSGELRQLAARVREKFNLLDCVVVYGRKEMLGDRLSDSVREAVVDDIARAAASELERRFFEAKAPYLAMSYGYTARKVADAMSAKNTKAHSGWVLPAQGIRRRELDRFGANEIARDVARHFGCSSTSMPIPGVVTGDKEMLQTIQKWELVREVMERLDQVNLAFFSVGTLQQSKEKKASHSAQHPLMGDESTANVILPTESEIVDIRNRGGIGNLGGWWFDQHGKEVPLPANKTVLGLGLERIGRMVEHGHPVILAAGADAERLPALVAALTGRTRKLCNIWIGDEMTARVLLGDWQPDFTNPAFEKYDDSEKAIVANVKSFIASDRRRE